MGLHRMPHSIQFCMGNTKGVDRWPFLALHHPTAENAKVICTANEVVVGQVSSQLLLLLLHLPCDVEADVLVVLFDHQTTGDNDVEPANTVRVFDKAGETYFVCGVHHLCSIRQ